MARVCHRLWCLRGCFDPIRFWIIDYRIFDNGRDSLSKCDHVREKVDHTMKHKQVSFHTVLMDSWYAARPLILHI